MKKVALISGITGQDGSYLTELLLDKGYTVHGIIRRSSSFNTFRIDHLFNNKEIYNKQLFLHYGDLTDSSNLNRLVEKTRPDEIYNLGAQSHVHVSFEVPEYTAEVDGIGTLRFLDAIKENKVKTRFYQASTSELYGLVQEIPQTEKTPFYPRSPYAAAKLYSYWVTVNYREAYGLFASNGILFNHESERRGKTFVTRKISVGVSKIILGMQDKLFMGNLDSKRDWGYAPEYAEGKRASEMLCAIYGKQFGCHIVVARIFALLGPLLNLDIHFAAGNFIRDAISGKKISVSGDGRPERSYLYPSDLVVWLLAMLTHGNPGAAYNAGSEEGVSIADLAKLTSLLIGNHGYEVLGLTDSGWNPGRYVPSNQLIQEQLNVKQTVSLAESIKRTAYWNGWREV